MSSRSTSPCAGAGRSIVIASAMPVSGQGTMQQLCHCWANSSRKWPCCVLTSAECLESGDFSSDSAAPALLFSRPSPLRHCPPCSGKYDGPEAQRLAALRLAALSGAAYVDVELKIAPVFFAGEGHAPPQAPPLPAAAPGALCSKRPAAPAPRCALLTPPRSPLCSPPSLQPRASCPPPPRLLCPLTTTRRRLARRSCRRWWR